MTTKTTHYQSFTPQSTNIGGYRYFFDGQEVDNEVFGEVANFGYEFRQYDSRLARWWSIDPKWSEYPGVSSFVFCNGSPVMMMDPDGQKFRLVGEKTIFAFRHYLLSYNGVNRENMYEAFSLAYDNPNMIMFKNADISYKQFSLNYRKVTGERLKNKDAKRLFKAIKSDFFIEVNLISNKSISECYTSYEMVKDQLSGESNFNAAPLSDNPALSELMIDVNSVNFDNIFYSSATNYGTSNSKFFLNTTGDNSMLNKPAGIMMINARDKSEEQAQGTLINEILDFYNSSK